MFGPRKRLKALQTGNGKRRPWGYQVPNGNKWQEKVDARHRHQEIERRVRTPGFWQGILSHRVPTFGRGAGPAKEGVKSTFVSPVSSVSPSMKFIGMTVDIERQGNNSPSRDALLGQVEQAQQPRGLQGETKGTGQHLRRVRLWALQRAANPDKVKRFDGFDL